ncbi:MAG: hypothetical protein QME21_01740 [Anaerolineales bacterium]|nr:hypothetical protein [Anaerolineales bacterium]
MMAQYACGASDPRHRRLSTWLSARLRLACLFVLLSGLLACNIHQPTQPMQASSLASPAPGSTPTSAASPTRAAFVTPPPPSTQVTVTPGAAADATEIPRIPTELPRIEAQSAAKLAPLTSIRFGPWELTMALAWSPDGKLLAISAGEYLHLYRATDWQRLSSTRIGSLTHSLAFSPDGVWLAAGSRDGYLRLWSTDALVAATDAPPRWSQQAHRKGVNMTAFSPQLVDGDWLLASGGNDAVARFWEMESGENIGLMVGGTFAVPSIAFLPDGKNLAVTNGDRIRLREIGTERITGTLAADVPLYSLAVSPDGRWLASGGSDNRIRLWEPQTAYRTGQEKYPQPVMLSGHNGRLETYQALIWQVAFNPQGDLLASVGGDGNLYLWDILLQQPVISRFAHVGGATCLAFRPDGQLLATSGLDGNVLIWGIGQ